MTTNTEPLPTRAQENATKALDSARFLVNDLVAMAGDEDELIHHCVLDLIERARTIERTIAVIERETRRKATR